MHLDNKEGKNKRKKNREDRSEKIIIGVTEEFYKGQQASDEKIIPSLNHHDHALLVAIGRCLSHPTK